jgi:CRISPR-associated protein Cas1
MNADDTLYGRIKNGVLTLSGNNSHITVDGGCLRISDGAYERSAELRLRRANCPLSRIVVTRPDGIISFAAIKWLHGIGAGLVQLDWDGTVLLATAPAGTDQPALRRAQVLAAVNEVGHGITRELLRSKLHGQAAVARYLGSNEVSDLIIALTSQLDDAADAARLLAIEATAATAYWPLWQSLPLQFARRHEAPEHWRAFGGRHSPLSGKPRKAASPGNAILNYLYAVIVGEMTIALTGAGLDPALASSTPTRTVVPLLPMMQ